MFTTITNAARLAKQPRMIHTGASGPNFIGDLTSVLAQRHPCFTVSPADVDVLSSPQQFYNALLDKIRHARRRVFISSLYIGAEDIELIDTLHSALKSNESLQLDIHLDLNRSTRPGPSSPAKAVLPLVSAYPDRVNVFLFRSPKLKGLLAALIPPRFNEGWGTWHPKIYGVDDDVMISGANLNSSYFTDRQDRYLRFRSHPEFAQYCRDFLNRSSTFSYQLLPSSSQSNAPYNLHWPDPHTHPHHLESKAKRALTELQSAWVEKSRARPPPSDTEVLLFPVIQAGQFGIREEEQAIGLIFDQLAKYQTDHDSTSPTVDLTSGYFGLSKLYQSFVLQSGVHTQLLCASPQANGFYNSRGISGRIPEAYTYLEQRFMKVAHRANVSLKEWNRDGWTYHAKGIWIRPTPPSLPTMTLFGSTNLNSRSSNLDTELSFIMTIPENSDDKAALALRQKLQDEVQSLKGFAVPWRGESRHVRTGTKALVGLGVEGML